MTITTEFRSGGDVERFSIWTAARSGDQLCELATAAYRETAESIAANWAIRNPNGEAIVVDNN